MTYGCASGNRWWGLRRDGVFPDVGGGAIADRCFASDRRSLLIMGYIPDGLDHHAMAGEGHVEESGKWFEDNRSIWGHHDISILEMLAFFF